MASCGLDFYSDSVTFTEEQPAFEKPILKFKKKWQGMYLDCNKGSEGYLISESTIIGFDKVEEKLLKRKHIEDSQLTKDKSTDQAIIDWYKSKEIHAEIKGDTIYTSAFIYSDTISKQHFRRFKGHYYLNVQFSEENKWKVFQFYLNEDTLGIRHISPNEKLLNFDFVTKEDQKNDNGEVKAVHYSLNPDKKGFKELVKSGVFKNETKDVFCKINK